MQDTKELINLMNDIFSYCTCNSGGKVSAMRETLPKFTKLLKLDKNETWYNFCLSKDYNHAKVETYFTLPIKQRIKYNGNLLAEYKGIITSKLLDEAFTATNPISISTIKKDKRIKQALSNRLLKKWILKETKAYYDTKFGYDFSLNPRLFSLWNKKDESFEKLFRAKTLQKQLELLRPDVHMSASCGRMAKEFYNKVELLAIKGCLKNVMKEMLRFTNDYREINSLDNPWGKKTRIPLSLNADEDLVFRAFLKTKGKDIPDTYEVGMINYSEDLERNLANLMECLLYKYTTRKKVEK